MRECSMLERGGRREAMEEEEEEWSCKAIKIMSRIKIMWKDSLCDKDLVHCDEKCNLRRGLRDQSTQPNDV